MYKTEFRFETSDKISINAVKWVAAAKETSPMAVVQISHGMAEHVSRYDEFAKILVKNGFSVYGNDHRGHGKTANIIENIGFFASENGWFKVSEDMFKLTQIIKNENPNIPVFLLGHSMGALLSQTYAIFHSCEMDGIVLSGLSGDLGFLRNIAIFIAKIIAKFHHKETPSPFLNNLSFGKFNKNFSPVRTHFDWLTRDSQIVDNYVNDIFCGGIFSVGFFQDLLTGLSFVHKTENLQKIRKNLPYFLLSGAKDPVTKNGKSISEWILKLKKVKIENISHKIYADCRHEILNEINRQEIYFDIINWLKLQIKN